MREARYCCNHECGLVFDAGPQNVFYRPFAINMNGFLLAIFAGRTDRAIVREDGRGGFRQDRHVQPALPGYGEGRSLSPFGFPACIACPIWFFRVNGILQERLKDIADMF